MTLRPEPYLHLASDQVFRGLSAFAEEAEARSAEMTSLAIAWVLHHPRVDAAIIGPRTSLQLDAALSALSIALSDADAARLANLFGCPQI
jgi:aryl-alcohol dehydrogenase-like predicted oxidoreductase